MKKIINNKTKKTLIGVTLIATMFVMITFTTSFISMNNEFDDELTILERIEKVRQRMIASATDLDPGNGVSGIVNIYIYPHSATSTYNAGLLEANAYEHFDASFVDGEELEGETPHSTTFNIVMEYQYNDVAYDTDWNVDLVDAWCNESQLSISSQKMEHSADFFDQDGTTDAKINFYLQDADGGAGTGFTIVQLEQIDDIQFKAYYRA